MKLIKKTRKPMTIAEIMDMNALLARDYTDERVKTIAGKTFKTLWAVCNPSDSYKVVMDGFTTKGDAKNHALALEYDAYIFPYEVQA